MVASTNTPACSFQPTDTRHLSRFLFSKTARGFSVLPLKTDTHQMPLRDVPTKLLLVR